MEGESLPFYGGKESKLLFTNQRVLERAIEVDGFAEANVGSYKKFIDSCQAISAGISDNESLRQLLTRHPDSDIPILRVLGEDSSESFSKQIRYIGSDVEEMSGFFRHHDRIVKGKAHGTYQEIFSRLTTIGILSEMPYFEDSTSDLEDYVDLSNPNTFDIHIFFRFSKFDNSEKDRECVIKLNRNPDFELARKKLSDMRTNHDRQLSEFRQRYGKIELNYFKDEKGVEHHYYKAPLGKILKEVERRQS